MSKRRKRKKEERKLRDWARTLVGLYLDRTVGGNKSVITRSSSQASLRFTPQR